MYNIVAHAIDFLIAFAFLKVSVRLFVGKEVLKEEPLTIKNEGFGKTGSRHVSEWKSRGAAIS